MEAPFRCLFCQRVFSEADPACGRYKRSTPRLRLALARESQEAPVRAVARWHGVSEGLVHRSWLEVYTAPRAPARPHVFLGLDGFCVRRPGVTWSGLWDLQSRRPVAERDAPIRRAWLLKEGLRRVYRERSVEEARHALEAWLQEASASGLRLFQRIARTLGRWRQEVLNYWRYPLTNALVEGKHNRVKALKRRAYGYRNDRTLALRILNCFHRD